MRNNVALAVLAVASIQVGYSQSLGIGSNAPEVKSHKVVQGTSPKFGDGKLHIIEMFATW